MQLKLSLKPETQRQTQSLIREKAKEFISQYCQLQQTGFSYSAPRFMSALAAALDVKFSASCKLNACFEVISQQIYRILSPHPFVHCTLVRQRTFKISPPHSCHVKPSWSLTDTPREMRFCRSLGLGLYTTNNTFLLLL